MRVSTDTGLSRHPRAWSAFACLCVLQAACGAGWHQASLAPAGAFAPRQQVQVWSGTTSPRRLHGVRWSGDSLFGRDYLIPLECDSCTGVALPRARIDSVRLGNPSAGFWRSTGLVLGSMAGLVVVGCAVTSGCNWGD